MSHVHVAKHPAGTSVMSMRPAMLRRVRGEKWGVIMTRRLASEKENWWGCRLISSSTITTGESWPPAFWPERTVILCEAVANHAAPPRTRARVPFFKRIMEVSQCGLASPTDTSLRRLLTKHGWPGMPNLCSTQPQIWLLNLYIHREVVDVCGEKKRCVVAFKILTSWSGYKLHTLIWGVWSPTCNSDDVKSYDWISLFTCRVIILLYYEFRHTYQITFSSYMIWKSKTCMLIAFVQF